jgi:hypothetical protein
MIDLFSFLCRKDRAALSRTGLSYLARIWKGEAKSAITMIEVIYKRHKGHGTIPILWRLFARPEEKKLLVFTMSQ